MTFSLKKLLEASQHHSFITPTRKHLAESHINVGKGCERDTVSLKHINVFISMLRVAIFITAPNWKQPKCPLTVGWRSRWWCEDIMEEYTAMRMTTAAWPNLTNITSAKEARHTRVHPGSFHGSDFQNRQTQPLVSDVRITVTLGAERQWMGRKGASGVLIRFCFLIQVLVTQAHSLWKFTN